VNQNPTAPLDTTVMEISNADRMDETPPRYRDFYALVKLSNANCKFASLGGCSHRLHSSARWLEGRDQFGKS